MKQISILMALMLTALVAGAQTKQKMALDMTRINYIEQMAAKSSYEHRMTGFRANDNYESTTFYYENSGRLIAVRDYQSGEYEVIDSLYYNEQGQLIKLAGFQKMTQTIWRNVYYIDYTYDPQGNLATRTNYNMFSTWELGGVYTYTYNDNHQITLSSLVMGGTEFQQIRYTYDPQGRLSEEVWCSYDGTGVFPDEKFVSYYDADGRLYRVVDSVSSDGGLTWTNYGVGNYLFDEYGNVTEYHHYDAERRETLRSIYEYDYTMLLSATQIPWHPELITRPKTYSNTHCYTFEEFWELDVDFVLQHVCDYLYSYDNYVGIADRQQPTLSVYPNPTQGRCVIQGQQIQSAMLFNTLGQVVKTYGATDQIDLSDLPTGIYSLRVKTAHGIAVQQVVRQ